MCDLLWSDPMDEATAEYLEDDALEAWYNLPLSFLSLDLRPIMRF